MTFREIVGFRLVTAEPERLSRFYRDIGFDVGASELMTSAEIDLLGLSGGGVRIPMSLGESRVALECYDRPGRPYPADTSACDLVFQHFALVTGDAAAAWEQALGAGATPISRGGPVKLPEAVGGVTAVKFRDPEGHPLELLQFPPGSARGGGTGRRIDHSAIAVADVASSRQFYRRHGLREAAATVNHGPTQDRLDGLANVLVDVVPMSPRHGTSHVELLGYRNPTARASGPLAANDIGATRIVWRSDDLGLVRDPDGHLHQLTP